MMIDNDAIGPWPGGCNPEQCPYVAELFLSICDELNDKSDIPNHRKAVWDAGTFGFAARRIRKNANALLEAVGMPKKVDAKAKAMFDQYYMARYALDEKLNNVNDRMGPKLHSAEVAKLNALYLDKMKELVLNG